MGKNKLSKYADLASFPNVYQNAAALIRIDLINHEGEAIKAKGCWKEFHFKNDQPIVLELACGNGDYTIGMAQLFPEKSFIGIDIKGNRIWQGAKFAIENKLANVAFVRTQIELLENYFGPGEIDEIWITFPDPFLSDRRLKNRLTYTKFLRIYKYILKENGFVNLKTDSTELYEFTKEMLELNQCKTIVDNDHIYKNGYEEKLLDLKTKYEKMHLARNRTIKYLKFQP